MPLDSYIPTNYGDYVYQDGLVSDMVTDDFELEDPYKNSNSVYSAEFLMSGTSQAAGVVSGLAALILQARPELSTDEVAV